MFPFSTCLLFHLYKNIIHFINNKTFTVPALEHHFNELNFPVFLNSFCQTLTFLIYHGFAAMAEAGGRQSDVRWPGESSVREWLIYRCGHYLVYLWILVWYRCFKSFKSRDEKMCSREDDKHEEKSQERDGVETWLLIQISFIND